MAEQRDQATDEPETATSAERRFVLHPEFRDYYADAVALHANVFTVTMDFGTLGSGGGPTEIRARVRMSPQHAKALVTVLSRHVRNYEAAIGELPLPQEEETPDDRADAGEGE